MRKRPFEVPKPGPEPGTLVFACGAIIDESDYDIVANYHWYPRRVPHTTYAHSGRRGAGDMHRLILQAKRGLEVDHRDGNGLNNRRSNLRVCTPSQNRANTHRRKPGMKGAYWDKRYRRWVSCIRSGPVVNGRRKMVSLGIFPTQEAAAAAYAKAAREAFGEFACTAFGGEDS